MYIRNLATFITVARLLSFGEAARMLNYSQSTVSEQIRSLEEELGVRVFERMGRKVFLTEQGKRLLPYAQRLVRDTENLKNLFSNDEEISGTILIGAAETLCAFWLPPILKEYRTLYPHVQINIKVGNCVEFPQWLQQNLVDVAFSLQDNYKEPQLREQTLFIGDTMLIAAPDHELAALEVLEIGDLTNQTLLMPEGYSGYPMDLKLLLEKEQVQTNTILEFGSLESIKQCVKNGLGISLLPEIAVAEEVKRGEIVKLNWLSASISIKAQMVFHRDKWLSSPLAALESLILAKL
ncbi:MAG: LysR family transcriptional regulator [Pelosinus sp.]|nr:LysR family transcriptional regulator [Pelosinus sp.]